MLRTDKCAREKRVNVDGTNRVVRNVRSLFNKRDESVMELTSMIFISIL